MYNINDNKYTKSANLEEITFVDYNVMSPSSKQKSNEYLDLIRAMDRFSSKNRFSFPGFIKENSQLFVVLGVFGAIALYLSSFIKKDTNLYSINGTITGNITGIINASISSNANNTSIFSNTNELFAQYELILTIGSIMSLFIFLLIGLTIIYECYAYQNISTNTIINNRKVSRFQKKLSNTTEFNILINTIRLISNLLVQILFLLAFAYILLFVSIYVLLNPITLPFVYLLSIVFEVLVPIAVIILAILYLTRLAISLKNRKVSVVCSVILLFLYGLFFIILKYLIKAPDTTIIFVYILLIVLNGSTIYFNLKEHKADLNEFV